MKLVSSMAHMIGTLVLFLFQLGLFGLAAAIMVGAWIVDFT
jgi:hypothetical protein